MCRRNVVCLAKTVACFTVSHCLSVVRCVFISELNFRTVFFSCIPKLSYLFRTAIAPQAREERGSYQRFWAELPVPEGWVDWWKFLVTSNINYESLSLKDWHFCQVVFLSPVQTKEQIKKLARVHSSKKSGRTESSLSMMLSMSILIFDLVFVLLSMMNNPS